MNRWQKRSLSSVSIIVCSCDSNITLSILLSNQSAKLSQNSTASNSRVRATENATCLVPINWRIRRTFDTRFSFSWINSRLVSLFTNQFWPLVIVSDFWTSGTYDSKSRRWQWLISNNKTRVNLDPSIDAHFGINADHEALYVSFNESANNRLISSSSSETYSTICKISATNLLLNNQTRSIDLVSHQTVFNNQ